MAEQSTLLHTLGVVCSLGLVNLGGIVDISSTRRLFYIVLTCGWDGLSFLYKNKKIDINSHAGWYGQNSLCAINPFFFFWKIFA
jgi:hypothetical protein